MVEIESQDRFGEDLGEEVWEGCNAVFDRLPLATVIDHDIFCVHGGIPRPLPDSTSRVQVCSVFFCFFRYPFCYCSFTAPNSSCVSCYISLVFFFKFWIFGCLDFWVFVFHVHCVVDTHPTNKNKKTRPDCECQTWRLRKSAPTYTAQVNCRESNRQVSIRKANLSIVTK